LRGLTHGASRLRREGLKCRASSFQLSALSSFAD
jgi:hypothetical protein